MKTILRLSEDFDIAFFKGSSYEDLFVASEECDIRERKLKKLHCHEVVFKSFLWGKRRGVFDLKIGLKRRKGFITLGSRALNACWKNRRRIPKEWREVQEIFFDGLVFGTKLENGECAFLRVPYLTWYKGVKGSTKSEWLLGCRYIEHLPKKRLKIFQSALVKA